HGTVSRAHQALEINKRFTLDAVNCDLSAMPINGQCACLQLRMRKDNKAHYQSCCCKNPPRRMVRNIKVHHPASPNLSHCVSKNHCISGNTSDGFTDVHWQKW